MHSPFFLHLRQSGGKPPKPNITGKGKTMATTKKAAPAKKAATKKAAPKKAAAKKK